MGTTCMCMHVCTFFVRWTLALRSLYVCRGGIKAWPTDRDRSNFFVLITGFNDNDNMMLVVDLVVVFVVNFALNKMRFRVMKE